MAIQDDINNLKAKIGLTPTNPTIWQRQTSSLSHSSGSNPPSSPGVGDEWYDTTAGVLFKYISDGNTEQWVEIS